jgi:hypothetical protein
LIFAWFSLALLGGAIAHAPHLAERCAVLMA